MNMWQQQSTTLEVADVSTQFYNIKTREHQSTPLFMALAPPYFLSVTVIFLHLLYNTTMRQYLYL
jgi:hypothetical protein